LDEVGEVNAPILVAAGPVDNETEVGGHHLAAGGFVSTGHPLGQFGLRFVIGERVVIEVPEEQAQAVSV